MYRQRYEEWLTNPYFDRHTKEELQAIQGDEDEIRDRFYRELSFGTGGLRGILGAGTNRMNLYTVGKATQGLADYILKTGGKEDGVVIAFDSRRCSSQFALHTALCLCANGIRSYLFEDLRPTPELSFAVRYLGCTAGVVITASHNPPQYNGYKVYYRDGGQITPPLDKAIIDQVNQVAGYDQCKTMKKEAALQSGLLQIIGREIDDAYIQQLKAQLLHPECIPLYGKDLRIVYTPLHGTGGMLAKRILKEIGFTHVTVVPQQEQPDGDFPTVSSPNPEDKQAFTLALALAREVQADLVLATDPDADRLGAYVRDQNGNYRELTGNMSGMLLCEYELSQRQSLHILPENGAIVKTIVTGNMSKAAAARYHTAVIETLTGFKYIGEQIKRFEEQKNHTYLFGYEESYGCLIGTYARDKDAIVAVMALCEAAAYYRSQNKTLWEQMETLYERYGYYKETLLSLTLTGAEGAEQIRRMMEEIRQAPPKQIGGFSVIEMRDYLCPEKTGLPSSNVLYFSLAEDGWCCMRPSGTEPKIKFYLGVKGRDADDARQRLARLEADPVFHQNVD